MLKKETTPVTRLFAVTQMYGKKRAERRDLLWLAIPGTVLYVKKEVVAGVM